MAINRESANDVSFSLKIIRDGEEVESKEGADKVDDFVISCICLLYTSDAADE